MSSLTSFDRMITPAIIKIIFWIGVVASIIWGIVLLASGGGAGAVGPHACRCMSARVWVCPRLRCGQCSLGSLRHSGVASTDLYNTLYTRTTLAFASWTFKKQRSCLNAARFIGWVCFDL